MPHTTLETLKVTVFKRETAVEKLPLHSKLCSFSLATKQVTSIL